MPLPAINGVSIKIYGLEENYEKHDFRERVKDRDKSYGLLKTLKAQPVWFSSEEMRFKEEILKFHSLGYFIFRASKLEALGISPAPDAKSWIDYRLAPKVNGSYSDRLLHIVEVRKESPLNGKYHLWYVYFDEVKQQPVSDNVEVPREERNTKDLEDVITEVVREH
ncbi:MAG: hypothetical protein HKP62_02315 [Sulfurovum sp.]|nr:hypothetical protein [Sulfurovum sp.]NNJ44827.1 hypothetical protein [Sulfurovum sp.]